MNTHKDRNTGLKPRKVYHLTDEPRRFDDMDAALESLWRSYGSVEEPATTTGEVPAPRFKLNLDDPYANPKPVRRRASGRSFALAL